MPDPLSVATGVSALVGTAVKGCKTIWTFIDGIKTAPAEVCAISDDLKAFYTVLATLRTILDDEEMFPGLLHPLASPDLESTMNSSIKIFQELTSILNAYFAPQINRTVADSTKFKDKTRALVNMSTWKSVQYTSIKELDVKRLRDRLAQNKKTLNIAISVANL